MPLRSKQAAHICFCFLVTGLLLSGCGLATAGEPVGAEPALEVHPGPEGVATMWLVAPPGREEVAALKLAPQGAREGEAAPGGGKWRLHVSEFPYVDLTPALNGTYKGSVWCAARLRSPGGRRNLALLSSQDVKVFLNGQVAAQKAVAPGVAGDYAVTAVELPPGESEVAVAVGIRFGQAYFKLHLLDAQALKAAADERWVLPVAKGVPPDAGAALARAVSLRAGSAFITEGQPTELKLELRAAWPAGMGAVTPRFRGPGGAVLEGVFQPRTPEDLFERPWSLALPASRTTSAAVEVTCELRAGERTLGVKKLRLFAPSGIRAEWEALKTQLEQARAEAKRPLPYTELAVEKLGLWLEYLGLGARAASPSLGDTLLDLLATARTHLEAERAGRDPFAGRMGYFERAYTSAIDGSPQPYFVMAPSAAATAGAGQEKGPRFPLVVFLHGYVPDYHKHQWWTPFDEFNTLFEQQGAFMALPFGRSNADFLGPGEVDVLDVVNEMKRLYPIDEERVYLYGYSMGGMGVYTLASHYPDRFAAGVVLAGRAYSPLLMHTGGMDALPPFKQFLIRTDQPLDLCEDLINFPVKVFHGRTDQFVPVSEAEAMVKRIVELGGTASLQVVEGDHYALLDTMTDPKVLQWLLEQRRLKTAKVHLKNYSLRFGEGRFGRVEHVSGELAPFELAWEGPGQVTLLSGPVTRASCFTLGGAAIQLPAAAKGFKVGRITAVGPKREGENTSSFVYQEGWVKGVDSQLNPAWKTPSRSGPVKEATYGPFVIVYGTTGGAEVTACLKQQADDFSKEWYEFAKGAATVRADREVTVEERKTRNLFIFGEEQENLLHAEAAKTGKLPFEVKNGQAKMGDKMVPLSGRGLMYICPSPLPAAGANCSIVVVTGVSYGKHLPTNHKLDLVPDFLVFGPDPDTDGTLTNRPVVAGFFDGRWKLSPATTWWFPEPKP